MRKRRVSQRKRPKIKLSSPAAIKLSISVGIFIALALIKIFDPGGADRMSGAVNEYIGDKTPLTIEAIGKAITGGDSLIAVFQNLSDVLTGRVRETAGDTADIPPAQDAGTPEDAPPSNGETPGPLPALGPIEIISEDNLLSGGDLGVDDTLPLPFGYDAPPNVDYTKYELPFEYTTPVEGAVSSGFGYRAHPIKNEMMFHYGTDIPADTGTGIAAFAAGTVEAAGFGATYGNYLLINHGGGVASFYAHCDKLFAGKGAEVGIGQIVASAGNTGLSTGPHLHFELRRDGMILDPEHYI